MTESQPRTELLFSYGTLRQPEVQRATFGHEVPGELDAVVGMRLDSVKVTNPYVIRSSGSDTHPVLIPAADPAGEVAGTVFTLTSEQLAAADDYEIDSYRRIRVSLKSGRESWVYAEPQPTRPPVHSQKPATPASPGSTAPTQLRG